MDGRTQLLSGDVPEGLLDAAEGTVEVHAAAPRREVVVGDLHEVFDIHGIAANQVSLELVDVCRYLDVSIGPSVALTPAVYPVVGVYLDETQVLSTTGENQSGFYISDFQGFLSGVSPCERFERSAGPF